MVLLYGKHACYEALLNKKRVINKIFCSSNAFKDMQQDELFAKSVHLKNNKPQIVDKNVLDQMFDQPVVHQGIVLKAQPLNNYDIEYVCGSNKKSQIVIILDQVTDPQNVGSILRLCRAFNADGLVMTSAHAPQESGAMAKVASGALEFVPRIIVSNLANSIKRLKDSGFWCVGLTERSEKSLREIDLSGKIAIIMGSEGLGMRKLTESLCDFKAFLPTSKNFSTLNVTMATAISLYEAFIAQNCS